MPLPRPAAPAARASQVPRRALVRAGAAPELGLRALVVAGVDAVALRDELERGRRGLRGRALASGRHRARAPRGLCANACSLGLGLAFLGSRRPRLTACERSESLGAGPMLKTCAVGIRAFLYGWEVKRALKLRRRHPSELLLERCRREVIRPLRTPSSRVFDPRVRAQAPLFNQHRLHLRGPAAAVVNPRNLWRALTPSWRARGPLQPWHRRGASTAAREAAPRLN